MDKLLILKAFEKVALTKPLEADGIRLYLLLLANCSARMVGSIEFCTITDALGNGFSAARLKQVCRRLSRHKLIEVVFPSPDKASDGNFTMTCRLIPPVQKEPAIKEKRWTTAACLLWMTTS